MKLKAIVAAAVIAAPVMFSSAAIADGAGLYKAKGCAGCHGADAKGGMGGVAPLLAGQSDKYVVEQFQLIRDGKRTTGKSSMMKGAVAAVTDDEITAIAGYLKGL